MEAGHGHMNETYMLPTQTETEGWEREQREETKWMSEEDRGRTKAQQNHHCQSMEELGTLVSTMNY